MKPWHARGVAALLTLTLWACGDATGSLEQAAYPDASAEPTPDAAVAPPLRRLRRGRGSLCRRQAAHL
jgi:hypothetical protein